MILSMGVFQAQEFSGSPWRPIYTGTSYDSRGKGDLSAKLFSFAVLGFERKGARLEARGKRLEAEREMSNIKCQMTNDQ